MLPAQTARRARGAGELGLKRSYGLAVSILGRLSSLSPCPSLWSWGAPSLVLAALAALALLAMFDALSPLALPVP